MNKDVLERGYALTSYVSWTLSCIYNLAAIHSGCCDTLALGWVKKEKSWCRPEVAHGHIKSSCRSPKKVSKAIGWWSADICTVSAAIVIVVQDSTTGIHEKWLKLMKTIDNSNHIYPTLALKGIHCDNLCNFREWRLNLRGAFKRKKMYSTCL